MGNPMDVDDGVRVKKILWYFEDNVLQMCTGQWHHCLDHTLSFYFGEEDRTIV